MAELHRLGIIHNNLRANRIMLDNRLQAKIGGFACAHMKEASYSNTKHWWEYHRPNLKWLDPQSAKVKLLDENSDIWAFGVTLWEIFSLGQVPYSGNDQMMNLTKMVASYEN